MKKRLRKKLRLGEFQELGFEVTGTFVQPWDDKQHDPFWHAFVDFVDAHGLKFGGGGGTAPTLNIFVDRYQGSCTEADRELVGTWLRAWGEMASVDVQALSDAWYPDGVRRRMS